MISTIVVGNPNLGSRTLLAARRVLYALTGGEATYELELPELGEALLAPQSPQVAAWIEMVRTSDLAVVASPTYKGSYTGLLKLFLDQIPGGHLVGVTGVPLMLGAGSSHSLAPEIFLKPVMVEVGITCPTRGIFLIDRTWDEKHALDAWLTQAAPQIAATTGRLR